MAKTSLRGIARKKGGRKASRAVRAGLIVEKIPGSEVVHASGSARSLTIRRAKRVKKIVTSNNLENEFRVASRHIADGLVDVDKVAKELGLTKAALAQSLGFSGDTLQRFSRVNATKTQRRLREFLEIVTRVAPWAGGTLQAMAWYRGQSIPALGDQTAEALVKQDRAAVVRTYLDSYAAGGYA